MISEFRWVKIKRKSGSILLDNQHHPSDKYRLIHVHTPCCFWFDNKKHSEWIPNVRYHFPSFTSSSGLLSFGFFIFPPFKMLIRICFFAIKKGHLERFILNDLISHKRQGPCSSYFFLPDFSETKFFYLFYRHKYKSQNHNNTRYSMRQQFIFCILCYMNHLW